MDVDNTIINSWEHQHEELPASMPYLINGSTSGYENTILVYPCRCSNPSMVNGGYGGKIILYDWNNNIIFQTEICDENYQAHHDIAVLPNNNILINVWERKTAQEAYNLGRININNSIDEVWSNAILEIEIDFESGTSDIVWEWHLWDHLIQDVSPLLPNYGNISENPQLFDINLVSMGSNIHGDWVHCNSIDYNEYLDQIVLSYPGSGEIFVIDHSTSTEEAQGNTGGNAGFGGDFLYRWGNPQNYGRGSDEDQILFRQHSVNWIKSSILNEQRIIIFNNNHLTEQNSTVLEISPPLDIYGNYNIDNFASFLPLSWDWIHYTNIFSPFQSGAYRLENDNTLITLNSNNMIYEINMNNDVLWSYETNDQILRVNKYGYNAFDFQYNNGDINNDSLIDILDIVMIINIVLDNGYNQFADLNDDGVNSILDIVQLVNIILN
tara:strand:- start:32 stop:1348 length:1317 start_codon:yes stop_codon:yes gene_type:complete